MRIAWWQILLAAYLFIVAILLLTNIDVVFVRVIQGVLAAGAGLCLLLNK
jgi:hypothetical protein